MHRGLYIKRRICKGIIYEKATCICSATGFRVFDSRLLTQSFRRKNRFCAKAAFSTQNMRLFAASRPNSPAAQTSVPCPPTHSPGSQEEAMPLKSGTRGRRWSCAGGWRERGGREEILRWEVRKMVNCVESVAKFVELGVLWGSWVVY